MINLFDQVKSLIDNRLLLPAGCVVVAGVSGGPDSMAMLAILSRLRKLNGFELQAAHVNHGLRANALHETELVRQWCQQNEIILHIKNVNLKIIARVRNRSLEEAGRDVRREFFFECKNQIEKQRGIGTDVRIALAHHMQDQAETLILNLSRGSGLDGLAGMSAADLPFVRPLLYSDPSLIKNWLGSESIPWLMDESNEELSFTRNKIRHLLFPVWQELLGYNPIPLLARAADNLECDRVYLSEAGDAAFEQSIRRTADNKLKGLDCGVLAQQPESIRFRVMRRYFAEVAGSARDFSKVHADLLQEVLLSGKGPFDLPGEYVVSRSGSLLTIARKTAGQIADYDYVNWESALKMPGETMLPDNLGVIRAEVIEYQPDFRYNSQMNCFSLQGLMGCKVRFRRPGDRIRPVGRSGSRTLKKFMNEQKVPVSERCQLPLVAAGSDIVWVPGYGCGQEYCVTRDKTSESCAEKASTESSGENVCVRLIWLQTTNGKSG